MKNYYDFLKEELNQYAGDFDRSILHVPDFFRLLCGLLDEDLTTEDRRLINSALAYFVVPNDVIPENIYGPVGYVDDLYVCARVLMVIKEKHGLEMLESHWQTDEDLEDVLQYTLQHSTEVLIERNELENVIKYASL